MNILVKIFGSKTLAEYYIQLGNPKRIQDLFQYRERITGTRYATSSRKVYTSKLHVKEYIDDNGYFTEKFYDTLKQTKEQKDESEKQLKEYMDNIEIQDEVEINAEINLQDMYELLYRNTNIKFTIPNNPNIQNSIDFDDDNVQLVKLNNLSHYIRYPQYIRYAYMCPNCGTEYKFKERLRTYRCRECKTGCKINTNLSDSISCYIYVIDYGVEQYVSRSLVELPLGDFIAAVIIVKDLKTYSLFILATKKPDRPKIKLNLSDNEDRLKQLVEIIDDIHRRNIGKQIYGMTYYKYAILLANLASLAGMTNYNIQVVGGGGLGKTSTARLYLSTISQKVKVQDTHNMSKAGARGSTKQIIIEGFTYQVHEPGLMERNNIVVLDEMLDADNDEVLYLKSVLGANTISVEISHYRTEVRKNAVAIATGNVPRWVREKRNKVLLNNEDPQVEFAIQNLWYLDGQNFNLLDRYALLFYLQSSDRQPDFNTADQEIDDITLRQKLYTQEIDNYFKQCATIKPFIPENMKQKLAKLSNRLYDPIHSISRKELFISMTAQLHAMINGRNIINDSDIKFTENIFNKCFSEIATSILDSDIDENLKKFDVWALKTLLITEGVASKEKIRVIASQYYDTRNFEDIFEVALHYGEITKVAPDRYRTTGWLDH